LFPDVGSTYFLPRIFNNDPKVGLYMGLTGDRLKGKEITQCGLATHFVTQEKLDKLRNVLIEKVNEESDVEFLKELVREFSELEYNPENFDFPKYEEIKRNFMIDSLDELFGRLQNLSDNGSQEESKWATNALNAMNYASPISLVVTYEQIKRGIKIKSLEEAFNLEAQLIAA
jgi:3-hydroxyisobutyryl-CoA hydrolase